MHDHVEDQVFIHMPALKSGPAHKLAEPVKEPYWALATNASSFEAVVVTNPRASSIRVALNQV